MTILRRNALTAALASVVMTLIMSVLLIMPAQTGAQAAVYTPTTGVLINNPLGTTAQKRRILDHLIRSVNSAPANTTVRIATWNLRSNAFVDALIAAHRRGVTVRFVMDYANLSPEHPNPQFWRLRSALHANQDTRPSTKKSWVRYCHGSCRAAGGLSHTKMYLFEKAGNASNVFMYGSVNATDLAANWQWNDLTTLVNYPTHYARAIKVFDEMMLDQTAPEPYQVFGSTNHLVTVWPFRGPQTPDVDPVYLDLMRVKCTDVAPGHGVRGRTHIRIAMTAMTDQRGIDLALRLKRLYDAGCEMKIIYAMFGKNVLAVLRAKTGRGPIPMRHIAQDFDNDCVYDRYLHTKVLAISGWYAGNPAAEVTWNGSANWTTNSMYSDEVGMRISTPSVRSYYTGWINNMFLYAPTDDDNECSPTEGRVSVDAEPVEVDPYAKMELD